MHMHKCILPISHNRQAEIVVCSEMTEQEGLTSPLLVLFTAVALLRLCS